MKRLVCALIALLMLISACFSLAGCTEPDTAAVYSASDDTDQGLLDRKLEVIEWVLPVNNSYILDPVSMTVRDYDVSLPFDWSCPEIDDRSTCYSIHGFTFLTNIYNSFVDEGRDEYRDLIISYMLDWIDQHPKALEGSEWAWHDDATARRVMRMSYYAYIWRDYLGEETYSIIKDSLDMQAELLASEDFYTEKHNHGMFQDMGLITYAYLICDDTDRSREYLELAIDRTAEYYDFAFTEDGAYREHSPNYEATCMSYIRFFDTMYEGTGIEKVGQLSALLDASSVFLAHLVMPDGTIPSIGDSRELTISDYNAYQGIYKDLSDNEEYLYAFSRGELGSKPDDEAVFPEGGYAVMRSSWEDSPESATYMLFMASTLSTSHKHSDDLSFLLYHGGPLIVEAGNKDYNYLEEETAYCYSGYGHNVLFIDDEEYPVKIGQNGFRSLYSEAYETGIIDYDISSDIKYVTGKQERFEGIYHARTLTYCESQGYVQVRDRISADRDCKGTLIFHIAPDVTVEDRPDGWDLYRNGTLAASVRVDCSRDTTLSTIREADSESPYKPWIVNSSKEVVPITLLKIDIDCTEGDNVASTNIFLAPLSE